MTVTDEGPELRHGPSLDDIREWGRQRGYDVPEKGRLPKGLRADFNQAHGIETPVRSIPVAPEDMPDDISPVVAERAPAIPKDTVKTRAKGFWQRGKSKPRQRPSRVKKPRVSIEDVGEGLWGLLSFVARPMSQPVSRMLSFQAPVAGMVMEDRLRGTTVDRVLQPFARAEDSGKTFAALLTPPFLMGLLEKYPEQAEKIMPVLRKSLVWWIEIAGPKITEKIDRERRFEEEYGADINAIIIACMPEMFEDEQDAS